MVDEANSIWNAIKDAITDIFRKKDQMEAVEKQEFRPYNTIEISLATARVNSEFRFKGDVLSVMRNDGTATIRFNEKDNDAIDLSLIDRVTVPYYRFFITNSAQTDKKLLLAIGRDAAFIPHISPQMLASVKDVSPAVVVVSVGAGVVGARSLSMDSINAKQVIVRTFGAGFDTDTGDAGSYVRLHFNDGTNSVLLKSDTGTQANCYWDKAVIDRGVLAAGVLNCRFTITYKNNGAGANDLHIYYNIEKVS